MHTGMFKAQCHFYVRNFRHWEIVLTESRDNKR